MVAGTMATLALPQFTKVLASQRYSDLKHSEVLRERQQVKDDVKGEALRGWTPNSGDDFDLNRY
jgi:hypothetical protein